MKTGVSDLPLHWGKAPPWLFSRMKTLGRAITEVIVHEYGQDEFLRRLSDPYFFQSLGCVLGFDWHSSGLTTTVCGALKESVGPELGLAVCGGKGRASRKAPREIEQAAQSFPLSGNNIQNLVHSSRLSAKIDNTALQDGYGLYHHVFIFSEKGNWCVIQQGLNPGNKYARRYHWLSEGLGSFLQDPQKVCCEQKHENVLNMSSRDSEEARKTSLDLVKENPAHISKYLSGQTCLLDFSQRAKLNMPRAHYIINMGKRELDTLERAYEIQPGSYEELLSIRGMGPKSVRALALISDLVYGNAPSWKDPVKYSFAHGGKDGIPRPVDREVMNRSAEVLRVGLQEAKLGRGEKLKALKRLEGFY